jgi:hypothetical protein
VLPVATVVGSSLSASEWRENVGILTSTPPVHRGWEFHTPMDRK